MKGGIYMWRVCWYGSFCEFSRSFENGEEAKKFYDGLYARKKEIYFS